MKNAWITPIILFIILQTSGAIWWAASINASVKSTAERFVEFTETSSQQNTIQDSQIRANTIAIKDVSGDIREVIIIVNHLKDSMDEIKDDTAETNSLIREYFINR